MTTGFCPTVVTERLVLRPFHDEDLDDYHAVLMTPEVRDALDLGDGMSRDTAWERLAVYAGQWVLRGTGQWAVVERSSGRFVGRAGLHHPEREGWPGVEVGWAFHPDVWRRGYATEAGSASIDYAFHVLGLDEVYSTILPTNTRSQAVATRLGFQLLEERVLPHYPKAPHGIWRLRRDERPTTTVRTP